MAGRGTQKKRSGLKSKNRTMKKRSTKRTVKRQPYRNLNLSKSIEKKIIDKPHYSLSFAQRMGVAGSETSGHNEVNCTPEPAQGFDANNRIGNRIMLTGARLDMEVLAQANCSHEFRYRWYLVRIPDSNNLSAVSLQTDEFLDVNPFAPAFYDWHSPTDHERKHGFKIVSSGTGKIAADQFSTTQIGRNQIRKYLKLGHIVKWDNSTTEVVSNQYRLILLGDSGNTTALSGVTANVNFRWYYTDN